VTSLYDLALVLRSKNAGPFLITIDIMLPDLETFTQVLESPTFTQAVIADSYGVPCEDVKVIPFAAINTIKVTLPRVVGDRGSGSPGDTDVYGAQHHGPLLGIDIPGSAQEGRDR
jgi:hypothetical protein